MRRAQQLSGANPLSRGKDRVTVPLLFQESGSCDAPAVGRPRSRPGGSDGLNFTLTSAPLSVREVM